MAEGSKAKTSAVWSLGAISISRRWLNDDFIFDDVSKKKKPNHSFLINLEAAASGEEV